MTSSSRRSWDTSSLELLRVPTWELEDKGKHTLSNFCFNQLHVILHLNMAWIETKLIMGQIHYMVKKRQHFKLWNLQTPLEILYSIQVWRQGLLCPANCLQWCHWRHEDLQGGDLWARSGHPEVQDHRWGAQEGKQVSSIEDWNVCILHENENATLWVCCKTKSTLSSINQDGTST